MRLSLRSSAARPFPLVGLLQSLVSNNVLLDPTFNPGATTHSFLGIGTSTEGVSQMGSQTDAWVPIDSSLATFLRFGPRTCFKVGASPSPWCASGTAPDKSATCIGLDTALGSVDGSVKTRSPLFPMASRAASSSSMPNANMAVSSMLFSSTILVPTVQRGPRRAAVAA